MKRLGERVIESVVTQQWQLRTTAVIAIGCAAAVCFCGRTNLSIGDEEPITVSEQTRSVLVASTADPAEAAAREYLKTRLMSREDAKKWLAQQAFPFCKYDAELGYLHIDRDFKEGVDGAICHYRYDELDARRMIAHAEKPCRINTYGNSFTSCEQVSDGETWQEVLAAHFGEPVRNYGVGGYSVYQAYLRMLREEQRAAAKYIILNIYGDDHERNLHGWARFKFGVNNKSPNPTVPHVRVDPDRGTFVEQLNPCPTPDSLYSLSDLDTVYEMFKDDYVLRNRLQRATRRKAGLPVPATDRDDKELMRYGIFATKRIVDRVQRYAARHDKRVLYVLSYGRYDVKQFIQSGRRFDQALVDYLNDRQLTYVDLLRAHAADFSQFKISIDAYLARYYVGHYAPAGNMFFAFAIKDALAELLDPKPSAYATKND